MPPPTPHQPHPEDPGRAMPTAEAHIATERPSRYLIQLCRHAAAMGAASPRHRPRRHAGGGPAHGEVRPRAEWSETRGVIDFPRWGRCTITAEGNTLALTIEATDEEGLRRIQGIVTADLDRFARRDPLTVTWS